MSSISRDRTCWFGLLVGWFDASFGGGGGWWVTGPAGVVVVEWLNASSGYEIDSTWAATSYEAYIRAGTTWVGLSLQNNVVQHLRGWSPQRYGALNVEPRPGSACPASVDAPVAPESVRINNRPSTSCPRPVRRSGTRWESIRCTGCAAAR